MHPKARPGINRGGPFRACRGLRKNRKCIFRTCRANTMDVKFALAGGISYMKATGIVRRIDDLGRVVTKGSVRPFAPARWNRPHYFELESLI